MKQKLFMMVCGLMTAMTVGAQPLLKTHVETGDTTPFPTRLLPWAICGGRLHSPPSLGRVC